MGVCVCLPRGSQERNRTPPKVESLTGEKEKHMSCPCTHCVYACRPENEMDGESHPILHDHPKKSRIQSHTPHTLAPLTKNIFEGQTIIIIIIMKLLSALLLSFSVLLGTFHLGKTTTVVLAQEDQQDRHLRWFHRKKKEAPKKKKHDYKPPHYMDVQNVGK